MPIIDRLRGLFGRKQTLADIELDDLMRERIGLEQEETKTIGRIDDLEKQKLQLFMQGKDEASDLQRRVLANKIKELDSRAKGLGQNLQFISRQLRIINGFTQLKENERLLLKSSLSTVISNMDLSELQAYVDQASLEGVFQMDKFSQILGALEEGEQVGAEAEMDDDVSAIMRAFEEAKLAEAEDPAEAERIARERLRTLARPASDVEPPTAG